MYTFHRLLRLSWGEFLYALQGLRGPAQGALEGRGPVGVGAVVAGPFGTGRTGGLFSPAN